MPILGFSRSQCIVVTPMKWKKAGQQAIKLIVNYIPQLASEEELHAMFSQVGVVENVRIMRDNRTGYSYGFGFVKYTSPQFAEAAITKFNGLQFKYILTTQPGI